MREQVKILHIDKDYRVSLFLKRKETFNKSNVPLESAITMLKKERFDLIISEPHHIAILTPGPADNEKILPDIWFEKTNSYGGMRN